MSVDQLTPLIRESTELIAILTTIVKKSREHMKRSPFNFQFSIFNLAAALLLLLTVKPAAADPTVTLDVKDEDVRVILKSMKEQCGIKNLLIDKDVTGSGTIYFREVSCSTAFRTVFKQFGLTGKVDPNIVTVEPRRN